MPRKTYQIPLTYPQVSLLSNYQLASLYSDSGFGVSGPGEYHFLDVKGKASVALRDRKATDSLIPSHHYLQITLAFTSNDLQYAKKWRLTRGLIHGNLSVLFGDAYKPGTANVCKVVSRLPFVEDGIYDEPLIGHEAFLIVHALAAAGRKQNIKADESWHHFCKNLFPWQVYKF